MAAAAAVCPICGRRFAQVHIQQHVNACMDGQSGRRRAAGPPTQLDAVDVDAERLRRELDRDVVRSLVVPARARGAHPENDIIASLRRQLDAPLRARVAPATPETSREGEGLMAAAPIGDRGGRLFVRVLELDRVHAREPLGA